MFRLGNVARYARTAFLALVVMVGNVGNALACPSCSPGDEQTRGAYLASTAVLTLLPLVIIGFLALGITMASRRARTQQR